MKNKNEKKSISMLDDKYIMHTYKRCPLTLVRGKGTHVFDEKGRKYLDFMGGIAVTSLGHCHPFVTRAIQKQAGVLVHTSNLYYTKPSVMLAKKLSEVSFPSKIFFSNSGAEANEAAIKLARKWGGKRYEIITFSNSFHGRTLATLSATAQKKYQQGFAPLVKGFKYVPFNNLKAVQKAVNLRTCAIMVEPIQGEGGVNVAGREFIKGLRSLCKKHGLLLIFDEVQSGIARTGKMFSYQHYGVKPDIMTLAKGLGAGMPIGVTVAANPVAKYFVKGTHGSTFGGNLVCCTAALAVLDVIEKEGLVNKVEKLGSYFLNKLNLLHKQFSFIREVRGKGFMLGMELNCEGKDIVHKCIQNGLLINCTMDNVIRFLPPLIVTKGDIDRALGILKKIFIQMEKRR